MNEVGWLVAEFTVEEVIEKQGLKLPSKFNLLRYSYSSKPYVLERYTGRVESVTVERLASYLPPIKGTVSINDKRFAEDKYVHYVISDAEWPKETDSIVVEASKNLYLHAKNGAEAPRPSVKRGYLLLIVAVVALIPIIFVLIRHFAKT